MKNLILSIATVILILSLLSLQGLMTKTIINKIELIEAAKDCCILISKKNEIDKENAIKIAKEILVKKEIIFSDVRVETIVTNEYTSYKVEISREEVNGKYVFKDIKKDSTEGEL